MRVRTCMELRAEHDRTSCYPRPPVLGNPLVPPRSVESPLGGWRSSVFQTKHPNDQTNILGPQQRNCLAASWPESPAAPQPQLTTGHTVSFPNFKSQKFKLSVSNPRSKYVAYVSILSQISNCQSLGRKNKHDILKTDRKSAGKEHRLGTRWAKYPFSRCRPIATRLPGGKLAGAKQ